MAIIIHNSHQERNSNVTTLDSPTPCNEKFKKDLRKERKSKKKSAFFSQTPVDKPTINNPQTSSQKTTSDQQEYTLRTTPTPHLLKLHVI